MRIPVNIQLAWSVAFVLLFTDAYSQDTIRLKNYFRELKTINVSIGGKTYDFLFDTGGGETFISPAIAEDLKKDVYGRVTGTRMNGEKVYYKKCDSVTIVMSHTEMFHTSLGIWDVMSVLPKELPRIDGVISLKSFNDKVISINLARNWIIIETKASYRKKLKSMVLLNSRFASGQNGNELTVFLGILHSRRLYWFLFDTGNITDFIMSSQTAHDWGLQNKADSVNNDFHSVAIPLGRQELSVAASIRDIIYDGALNYNVICKGDYVLDLVGKKVWLK